MSKNFYINLKDNREDAASSIHSFQEKIQFLITETGTNKKVLDVGCNDGYIGELLLHNSNDVYGIDVVKKKLQLARKRKLKVKTCDIERDQFPYPEGFFDIVILGDVIEHVFDTDLLLQKCKKVLKKNGKLLVTTPNVASIGRRIMLLFGISPFLEYSSQILHAKYPPVGHIRYYTLQTLRSQLKYNGFKKIRIQGDVLSLVFFNVSPKFISLPSLSRCLLCIAKKR